MEISQIVLIGVGIIISVFLGMIGHVLDKILDVLRENKYLLRKMSGKI